MEYDEDLNFFCQRAI